MRWFGPGVTETVGLAGVIRIKGQLAFVTVSVVSWSPSPHSSSSRRGDEVGKFVPSLGGVVNRLLVGKDSRVGVL
jgi:hypothetical protein